MDALDQGACAGHPDRRDLATLWRQPARDPTLASRGGRRPHPCRRRRCLRSQHPPRDRRTRCHPTQIQPPPTPRRPIRRQRTRRRLSRRRARPIHRLPTHRSTSRPSRASAMPLDVKRPGRPRNSRSSRQQAKERDDAEKSELTKAQERAAAAETGAADSAERLRETQLRADAQTEALRLGYLRPERAWRELDPDAVEFDDDGSADQPRHAARGRAGGPPGAQGHAEASTGCRRRRSRQAAGHVAGAAGPEGPRRSRHGSRTRRTGRSRRRCSAERGASCGSHRRC